MGRKLRSIIRRNTNRSWCCAGLFVAVAIVVGVMFWRASDTWHIRTAYKLLENGSDDYMYIMNLLYGVEDDVADSLRVDAIISYEQQLGDVSGQEAVDTYRAVYSTLDTLSSESADYARYDLARALLSTVDSDTPEDEVSTVYRGALDLLEGSTGIYTDSFKAYIALRLDLNSLAYRSRAEQEQLLPSLHETMLSVRDGLVIDEYISEMNELIVQFEALIDQYDMITDYYSDMDLACTVFDEIARLKNGGVFVIETEFELIGKYEAAKNGIKQYYPSLPIKYVYGSAYYDNHSGLYTDINNAIMFLAARISEAHEESPNVNSDDGLRYTYALGGGWEIYTHSDYLLDGMLSEARALMLDGTFTDAFEFFKLKK